MPRQRIKELRWVDAKDLIPDGRNWRRHPKRQRLALQSMLDSVGVANAVIARETPEGLVLVDGHLRQEMLADGQVPVLVVDLDEAEAGQVLSTLDPIAAMAQSDNKALQDLIDATRAPVDWGALMPKVTPPDVGQDETPPVEEEAKPRAQRGDVWLLGRHRLMCGDSTDEADVRRLLSGHAPRLMVTDPPYGVNYDPAWRNEGFGQAFRRLAKPVGDTEVYPWAPAISLIPFVEVAYMWAPPGGNAIDMALLLQLGGLHIRNSLTWVKSQPTIGRGHYHIQHEPCWYAVRKGKTTGWIGDRKQTTVIHADALQAPRFVFYEQAPGDPDLRTSHSTQKPVECMERPIRNHEGDVYDPFIGSGTTIIAAERQGRACYAMEIEPSYVDMAVRRWEEYTGQRAELEGKA